MNIKYAVSGLALGLSLAAAPSHASDATLPAQAASLIGHFIAQQGNAAVAQIREELRRDLTEALRPRHEQPESGDPRPTQAVPNTEQR